VAAQFGFGPEAAGIAYSDEPQTKRKRTAKSTKPAKKLVAKKPARPQPDKGQSKRPKSPPPAPAEAVTSAPAETSHTEGKARGAGRGGMAAIDNSVEFDELGPNSARCGELLQLGDMAWETAGIYCKDPSIDEATSLLPLPKGKWGEILQSSVCHELSSRVVKHFQLPFSLGVKHECDRFYSEARRRGGGVDFPTPYVPIRKNEYVFRREDFGLADRPVCRCIPCDGEPGCGPSCENRTMMVECTPKLCPCGSSCTNQRIQRGKFVKVALRRTEERGWALVVKENVERGQFLLEYVGEVITGEDKIEERIASYNHERHCYLLKIAPNEVIDATRRGNAARFINHCCAPNCEMARWNVGGEFRCAIFAIKDFPADTEITFDYQMELFGNLTVKCLCGEKACRGFLGARPPKPPPTAPPVREVSDSDATSRPKAKKPRVETQVGKPNGNSAPTKKKAIGKSKTAKKPTAVSRKQNVDEFGLTAAERARMARCVHGAC